MAMAAVKYQASWTVHALRGRRNPLCRPVDRVAALITALFAAVALIAIPATLPFGAMLHGSLAQRASRATVTNHQVTAVLTTNAQPSIDTTDVSGAYAEGVGTIRWNAANGPHSATIDVPLYSERGQQITIWTNQSGNLAAAPATPAAVTWAALFGATGLLLLILLACGCLIMGTQYLARTYGQRAWGREWDAMQRWGSWLQR